MNKAKFLFLVLGLALVSMAQGATPTLGELSSRIDAVHSRIAGLECQILKGKYCNPYMEIRFKNEVPTFDMLSARLNDLIKRYRILNKPRPIKCSPPIYTCTIALRMRKPTWPNCTCYGNKV